MIAGLLTWLLSELLEVILEGIGSKAAEVVNDVSPDINIAVPGLELVLQEAGIDDIKLSAKVRVPQYAPVRCEGSVTLRKGEALDLDSGTGGVRVFSGDVVFAGFAGLHGQCNTKLARVNARFDYARRFMLYGLPYQRGAKIPFNDLANFGLFPPGWSPSRNVYAYVTTEGRYGILQVTAITDAAATIRYLTFGEAFPKAAILGEFGPKRGGKWGLLPSHKEAVAATAQARFVPSRVHTDFQTIFPDRAVSHPRRRSGSPSRFQTRSGENPASDF